MLRCKINSDKENLDKLNKIYNWLPNSQSIRPNLNDLNKKKEILISIDKEWLSLKDYILHKIFGLDYVKKNGLNFVVDNVHIKEWIFLESTFKYNLCEDSNHFILWNSCKKFYDDFPDEFINAFIESELLNKLKHNNFDFAWYKNPKPTVVDFYHIQVFWIIK